MFIKYVKFPDEQACLKAMRSSYLGKQSSWVFTEKCEIGIPFKKGSASLSITCTQFPITWVPNVRKVQGLALKLVFLILIYESKNHVDDIVSDNKIINNGIIGFTEA